MKARMKHTGTVYANQIEEILELVVEYPYNTIEYQDALNALIRNLHKVSPSDIWKLIGE